MCDAMRDLEPFVQFKKYEKHPGEFLLVNITYVYYRTNCDFEIHV